MTNDLALLQDYIQRCSNWGRWGPDDQLGTVNLITPDKIREAAASVKLGKSISLTMPYDEHGPSQELVRGLSSARSSAALRTTPSGGAVVPPSVVT